MRREGGTRGSKAAWTVLHALVLAGSTGFATCGGVEGEEGHAESRSEVTIEQEQEDMEEDIDR
jgi:hypothetical protein